MLAKYERRKFSEGSQVWTGRYRSLHNMPHWHFESELIVCQEGSATVMLDGHFYTISDGMCVFCRSESVHYISASEDSLLVVAQFEKLVPQNCWLKQPVFCDRYHLAERLNEIGRECQTKAIFYANRVNALSTELIIDIFRGEELDFGSYAESAALNRYKEMLTEIERRFDDLTFSDAALFMNMSEAYFSRYFKRMTGMTFSLYLNVVRIDRAISILAKSPNITMAELMTRCGFNTLRNFNRVFKEITGYSPTQLPTDFVLNMRSLATEGNSFDPTLDSSVVVT